MSAGMVYVDVLHCTNSLTRQESAVSETTFTFRVDGTLKDAFAAAAKTRDRSGAQLLRDFMRDFVRTQEEAAAHEAWFRRAVQAGLEAANVGDIVAAEDVEADAKAWRIEARRKRTRSTA
jgi:predicted transcriptional regulator